MAQACAKKRQTEEHQMPSIHDIAIEASAAAHDESDPAGWNRRYVDELNKRGLELIPCDGLTASPPDSVHAPMPAISNDYMFEHPSIIRRKVI
jgi:hypothetical protein